MYKKHGFIIAITAVIDVIYTWPSDYGITKARTQVTTHLCRPYSRIVRSVLCHYIVADPQSCWLESPEVTRVALESLFSATRDSTRTLRYDLRLDSTWQPVTRDLTTYMARVANTNYNDYLYVSGSRTSFVCRTTSCALCASSSCNFLSLPFS